MLAAVVWYPPPRSSIVLAATTIWCPPSRHTKLGNWTDVMIPSSTYTWHRPSAQCPPQCISQVDEVGAVAMHLKIGTRQLVAASSTKLSHRGEHHESVGEWKMFLETTASLPLGDPLHLPADHIPHSPDASSLLHIGWMVDHLTNVHSSFLWPGQQGTLTPGVELCMLLKASSFVSELLLTRQVRSSEHLTPYPPSLSFPGPRPPPLR